MKSVVRVLLMSTLVAVLAIPLHAEEDKLPPKEKDPNKGQFTFPKQIKLDDKQAEALEKLRQEYSPKLTALTKKENGVVSADRKKAAADAQKKAKDAIVSPDRYKAANDAKKDKKGKEAAKAYDEALKLTDDEKAKLKGLGKVYNDTLKITKDEQGMLAAINKERAALLKEIATKRMDILTAEQKESLKPKSKTKDKPKDKKTDK